MRPVIEPLLRPRSGPWVSPAHHDVANLLCLPLLLALASTLPVACAGRTSLDAGPGGASGTRASGGAAFTGGTPSVGGSTGTGGSSSRGAGIPGLPTDALPVCTYTASGRELTVTVYRDQARMTYALVSKLFASPVVQPIGAQNDNLVSYEIARYHTLYVTSLANGWIRFVDSRHEPNGPGSSFQSTCTADGIQVTQLSKDRTLYLELTRADGTSYRVDVPEWWETGNYPIYFYTLADDMTTHLTIDTGIDVVSRNADGSANVAFADLDGRRLGIDLDSYSKLIAIRVSFP
jgi:hypothetical protein